MCQTPSSALIILRSLLPCVGQGIRGGDCLQLLNVVQDFPAMNQRDVPLLLARSHEGGHQVGIETFSALLFRFVSPSQLLGVNLVYFQSLAVVQH